jgi:quercetin dioxygenase-like cupin family protein
MDVQFFKFEKLPQEPLMDKVLRQFVSGEKLTLTRFELKKGAVVPEHSHPNEQISYILSGAAKFIVAGKEYTVRSGEVLIIPSNIPHRVEALEDTIDLEMFSPRRDDWRK